MQKTILLIEDNKDIRENVAELLELEGFRVITAENGVEGILQAQMNLPDLVICDVLMQEADGYTVFRTLLDGETTRDIPFVFITAKSESSDRAKAMEIGACDYLIKPFDEVELFTCITKMLSKGRSENSA
ncbi:MAG TPA: response regulator [Pedobacter sp.]|jgi:DNA-binding response OmpR family regulator